MPHGIRRGSLDRGDNGEETVRSVPKPGRRGEVRGLPGSLLGAVIPSAFAPISGSGDKTWQDIFLSYTLARGAFRRRDLRVSPAL